MAVPDWIETTESIATTLAVGAAGVWALVTSLRRRERYPKASISHKFTAFMMGETTQLIRVDLVVQNQGETLLRISSIFSWLQQVYPLATSPAGQKFEPLPTADNPEVQWPLIKRYDHFFKNGEREIEPGEQDTFQFDYVVPADIEIVQAYSYVTNPAKRFPRHWLKLRPKEIGWNTTDLFSLPTKSPRLSGEG